MIKILHGENTIKSREKLVSLLTDLQAKGIKIVRLEANKLNLPELEAALIQTDLFGATETVVIEELHSLLKSKRKDQLINLVAAANKDVILWEKRDLTKPMLAKFPNANIEMFKLSSALFSWLDLFHSETQIQKNLESLHKAIEANTDHMCFVMLMRQVRLLIQIKEGIIPPGAPFMIQKIKKQANYFSLPTLLQIHEDLFKIDMDLKSSKGFSSLQQRLDLLVVNLYSDKHQ
ncbi:MAG: hypothetical protein COU63_00355 [Candidatus Pacebacteria bacterium CG10_big_fil_rev_8_21_14_0_10_36_11]|nr:hypothetical protein [Candidatus Pacearchaeota archaeon]OIP74207.1 MAG: hypothetical protein AUK08_03105 [Candidatus Pacebacteria bacterium CG2_30_36_39]PIR65110.1 MAG: hypothetical protein COU63_00355 [Candidatus Pacebacteria bacterium CG10_big_fil_rev_8_21_14_0_10_36_11]PJC42665.1 MAG: hypothetical protein CO040_03245 [Candidatus Pacebacteria bacterium CG_4_9_14_0_2_um_filter_36_8]